MRTTKASVSTGMTEVATKARNSLRVKLARTSRTSSVAGCGPRRLTRCRIACTSSTKSSASAASVATSAMCTRCSTSVTRGTLDDVDRQAIVGDVQVVHARAAGLRVPERLARLVGAVEDALGQCPHPFAGAVDRRAAPAVDDQVDVARRLRDRRVRLPRAAAEQVVVRALRGEERQRAVVEHHVQDDAAAHLLPAVCRRRTPRAPRAACCVLRSRTGPSRRTRPSCRARCATRGPSPGTRGS